METLEDTYNINGPINVVRLEGNINGIHKILYVFFDWHVHEKKCNDLISINIDQYLIREFNNINQNNDINIKYDFFLETRLSDTSASKDQLNSKEWMPHYLGDLWVMFEKYNNIKFHIQNKKIPNDKNNEAKVRLHYIDIRDIFKYEMFELTHILFNYINQNQLLLAINELDLYIIKNNNIINILKTPKIIKGDKNINFNKMKTHQINTDDEKKLFYSFFTNMIYKLKNVYKNNKNKIIINEYINNIIQLYEKSNEEVQNLLTILREIHKENTENYGKLYCTISECNYDYNTKNLKKIHNTMNNIYDIIHHTNYMIYVLLTDLYFLRRFVDKDYITNGITYTGSGHSLNYIYILIKEYDFKITHSNYMNIEESIIKNEMKNKKITFEEIMINFAKYFHPEYFNQCVNMSKFPKLFT